MLGPGRPSIIYGLCGVRYWECLVQAVKRAGPHKILFGSDGPLLHPAVELYKIKMLGLPAAQQALITGNNIPRLLPEETLSTSLSLSGSRPLSETSANMDKPHSVFGSCFLDRRFT